MAKHLKFSVYIMLATLVSLSFFSCGDDDEEKALFSKEMLSGTVFLVYDRENYLNDEEVEGYHFSPKRWYFHSDGTCEGFEQGEWSMKGNSIFATSHWSGFTETEEYKIVSSETDPESGEWEVVLYNYYPDDEFDYQLYYMRMVDTTD